MNYHKCLKEYKKKVLKVDLIYGLELENCTLSEDKAKITIDEGAEYATVTIKSGYYKDSVFMVGKHVLSTIKIVTPPTKVEYKEKEDFDPTGMKVVAIYNDGEEKEIDNYTVDKRTLHVGDKYKVIEYTEDDKTCYVTQRITVTANGENPNDPNDPNNPDDPNDPNIPINPGDEIEVKITGYEIDENYLTQVQPNTTVDQIKSAIETNGTISIQEDNEAHSEISTENVSTGNKIVIIKGEKTKEFIIVVKGDVDGDSDVDFKDILKVNKHRLNKKKLEGAFEKAADVNKSSSIDFKDILRMNKFRLGKIKEL